MQTLTNENGKQFCVSVPITQHVTEEQRNLLVREPKIAIKCPEIGNQVLAVIESPEFFENRKEEISTRVFGTSSVKHPKIERIWK